MKDYMEKTELERKWEAELAAENLAAEEPSTTQTAEADRHDGGVPDTEALDRLSRERDELKEQLLRARAEFDNYRKRNARELDDIRRRAAEHLLRELLPVLDNLERALDHVEDRENNPLAQGVEMVLRQLVGVLEDKGLEPIPAVGERFDPNLHEALAQHPSKEHDPDIVTTEYQRGYRIGNYVLRPSKVVVSSGAPGTDADSGNPEEPTEDRGEE